MVSPSGTGLPSYPGKQAVKQVLLLNHTDVTSANMALQLHINVSLNRLPGRPQNKWLNQLRNDSTCPTGDLWRCAVDSGHGGATTRRPSPATRQCDDDDDDVVVEQEIWLNQTLSSSNVIG